MTTNMNSEGRGPAVVLIHGLGLDLSIWDGFVELLAPDHTVIRYDLLGHGRSQTVSHASLEDFDRQLLRLLDDLKQQNVTLIGFSLGGVIARSFALNHPARVRALVLLNTISRRTPAQRESVRARVDQLVAGEVDRVTDAAIERWFTRAFQIENPPVIESIRRRMMSNDPGSYLACYRLFASVDETVAAMHARIAAPALVVTGADDVGSTPAMAEEIAAAMPSASVAVLPRLKHMAVVEAPRTVHDAVKDFLRDMTASSRLAGD